jgi:hypothetical protein
VIKAFAQKNSIKRVEVVQTEIAKISANFNIAVIPFRFLYI